MRKVLPILAVALFCTGLFCLAQAPSRAQGWLPLGGVGGGGGWTPATPGSLDVWLESDLQVSHTGSTVTSWKDNSANGFVYAATNSPTYSATGFNSAYPGISTSQSLASYLRNSSLNYNAAAGSVFVLANFTSINNGRLFSLAPSSGGDFNNLIAFSGGSSSTFYGNAGAVTTGAFGDTCSQSTNVTCGFAWNGTSGSSYVNEVLGHAYSFTQSIGGGAGEILTLGADDSGAENMTVTYAAILVYHKQFTSSDLTNLSAYLSTKFGGSF